MSEDVASGSQRKHAMEALERRFKIAKFQLGHQKKVTNCLFEKNNNEHNGLKLNSAKIVSSVHQDVIPLTPPLEFPSKKDVEYCHPVYSKLSEPVHENLIITNAKFKNKKINTLDKILNDLHQHGDSASKYMNGSRSRKIDNWILLDNVVKGRSTFTGSYVRALQTHSKRSKARLSMKKHKKLGSLDLPHAVHKFDIFKPLHEIWKGHMMGILKNSGKNQVEQRVLRADLHGAMIFVVECKTSSFTGINGIMIRETAETFGIITQDNKFHVVPKKGSVFIFQFDRWKFTLIGDKLTSRLLSL